MVIMVYSLILKKINKKIIIVSKNIDEILRKKYESQYNNITFINNNSFHDRFIIIDNKDLYQQIMMNIDVVTDLLMKDVAKPQKTKKDN